jgi:hypothetical protein
MKATSGQCVLADGSVLFSCSNNNSNSSDLGSSVNIVSGYGLDDRTIEVRSPAEGKDFSSSLCVQTGCGAHPALSDSVTKPYYIFKQV